jgi:hypothetical protein
MSKKTRRPFRYTVPQTRGELVAVAYPSSTRGLIIQRAGRHSYYVVHRYSGAIVTSGLTLPAARLLCGALSGLTIDWTVASSGALYAQFARLSECEVVLLLALVGARRPVALDLWRRRQRDLARRCGS